MTRKYTSEEDIAKSKALTKERNRRAAKKYHALGHHKNLASYKLMQEHKAWIASKGISRMSKKI